MPICTRLLKTIAALALLLQTLPAVPYSIQSHEELIDLAWKHLLENHPHDSICGCSIDQVHQDMIYRFDQSILAPVLW